MALRRRFTQTKFFRALIVSAVLVLFMVFPPHFLFSPVRAALAMVVWPLEKGFSFVAFEMKDGFNFFASISHLKDENERLERERIALLSENARLSDIMKENEVLRSELGLLPREKYDLKASGVIGRDTAGLGNSLSIDQGTLQGIDRGMPVIVGQGVLIGRVEEVFLSSARVMLVSHPDSLINAVVSDTDVRGIVKGEHGLGAMFDMVLQTDTIRSGDTIVTSGLGGDMPEGLLIGTLQEPSFSADKLYQRASVMFPVKFDRLRYVFVIRNAIRP